MSKWLIAEQLQYPEYMGVEGTGDIGLFALGS